MILDIIKPLDLNLTGQILLLDELQHIILMVPHLSDPLIHELFEIDLRFVQKSLNLLRMFLVGVDLLGRARNHKRNAFNDVLNGQDDGPMLRKSLLEVEIVLSLLLQGI